MGQSRRLHQGGLIRFLCLATVSAALLAVSSSLGLGVASAATGVPLLGVSCPSTSFCVAVDQNGNAYTFDGSSWSAPVLVDSAGLDSVSCPTPSFCTAVGAEDAATFNGTSWSAPVTIDPSSHLTGVSCPSSSFCMAVGFLGETFTFAGSSWTAGPTADQATFGVSCVSPTFCVSVGVAPDSLGYGDSAASVYNGSSWTSANLSDPLGSLSAVSCVSASDCVAVGETGSSVISRRTGGEAVTFNGSSWVYSSSKSVYHLGDVVDLSCVGTSFCLATNQTKALLFDGTRSQSVHKPPLDQVSSVSCATATFCVAGDQQGHVSDLSKRAKKWVWSIPVNA